MSKDKQNEIHELANQMSNAISTAVEQKYIMEEAKLEAVLIENGWRKTSEVAAEIFAEIEAEYGKQSGADRGDDLTYGEIQDFFAELKKKYAEDEG